MNPQEPKSFVDESALEELLKKLQTSTEDIFPVKLFSPQGLDNSGEAGKLIRKEITLTTNSAIQEVLKGNAGLAPVIMTYLMEVGFQIAMSNCINRATFAEMQQQAAVERLKT